MNNLEELKKKYEELGVEIKRLEKENKRWRAEVNEKYYKITNEGRVLGIKDWRYTADNFLYKTRNYFKTEEEAQRHLEKINTYYDLMDLAEELNNGEIIDWNNDKRKHYIYYDFTDYELKTDYCYHYKDLGQIYCLNEDFLEIALEKIGEERLEKLFKGGANYGV